MTYFKLAFVTLGALAIGCGGSDSNSVDGNSGSGNLCASLPQNTGGTITDSVDSSAWPGGASLGMGGAIESGTFHQTQHIYYSPASTPNHMWSGTLVVDTGAGTILSNVAKDGATVQMMGETYTTTGNQITLDVVCPQAMSGGTFYYTYAGGTLTFYADMDKTATVFQKQ